MQELNVHTVCIIAYHCFQGGVQQVSEKLVQRLDKDSLRLGHPVVTITQVRMYIRAGFQL